MTDSSTFTSPIVAPPANSYRIKLIIMGIVCILVGAWFGYDGYVGYPEANRAAQAALTYKVGDPLPHTDMDILFQKALMVLLPILGIGVIAWCFMHSRGQYRLEGTTLHVPGHPPVELNSITTINKKKWDRKGIAFLTYEQAGKTGVIRIDDFAYQRGPTDEIFAKIEQYLVPPEKEKPAEQ